MELYLRPVGEPIRHWPGQYVTLGDARAGIPARAYSIATAPRPDGELVLQVARAQGGLTSTWVHDRLAIGDRVGLSGAYGSFIGDPGLDTPVLCLAAGTGLAPILALTEAALRRGFRQPVTLLCFAHSRAGVYGQGLMAWWRARYPGFDHAISLTRESAGGYLAGRVDAVLPGLLPDFSRHSVFAAGSPAFVNACVAVARALGVQAGRIHIESFFAHQPAAPLDAGHRSATSPTQRPG